MTRCSRRKRVRILPYGADDLILLLQTSGVLHMPLGHPVMFIARKKMDKYQFFHARIIWGQIALLNLIGFSSRIQCIGCIHLVAWAHTSRLIHSGRSSRKLPFCDS